MEEESSFTAHILLNTPLIRGIFYFGETVKMKNKKKKTNKQNLRAICVTAIMGALGAVLMLLEFPLPMLIPPFIKLDFSELPALITTFAFGPGYGVGVCLLKNLLHLISGSTMGIGELSNFILGTIFVLIAGLFYKKKRTKTSAIVGAAVGALVMAVVSVFTNYFVVYPLYCKVLGLTMEAIIGMYKEILPSVGDLFTALLIFNLPFTFAKGMIDTLICALIYKPISPLLKGN